MRAQLRHDLGAVLAEAGQASRIANFLPAPPRPWFTFAKEGASAGRIGASRIADLGSDLLFGARH